METLKQWFIRQGIEKLWNENVEEAEEVLLNLASEKQWDDIKEICNDFKIPKLKIAYLKGYLIKRVKFEQSTNSQNNNDQKTVKFAELPQTNNESEQKHENNNTII
eukprot:332701_1